jgi:hypothetical protein
MSEGFIKLLRSEAARELLRDGKAFLLLTAIASRAKRTGDLNIHGLEIGQALIGDHASYGLTKQEYRSAKARLKRYGLAEFKATPRGTIATLLDQRVYDINAVTEQHAANTRPAHRQHTPNTQPTHAQHTANH